MLGKQWLTRYDSADRRGSATEHGQNRQRKLDGIVAWYFDYVMQSLPLMLQTALLLLGFALSRYLWDINITIASVILGVTSFGALFYAFIVIAATASESCPYQTPFARIFRYILRNTLHYVRHNLLPTLRSAPSTISVIFSKISSLSRKTVSHYMFTGWWPSFEGSWSLMSNIRDVLIYLCAIMPLALVVDAAILLVAAPILLATTFCRRVYRQSLGRVVHRWIIDSTSPPSHDLDRPMAALDLRCISWILHASLDKTIRSSTLEYLVSVSGLSHFHPTVTLDCFNIFVGCVSVGSNGKVTIIQGLEELATSSITGFFKSFHNLTVMDPTSSVLSDLHRHYNDNFPPEVDFTGPLFHSTMTTVRTLVNGFGNPRYTWWDNHRDFPTQGDIRFSRRMARAAMTGYQQTQRRKVPRWMLRSALHFLSLCAVFPPFVISDCLFIIATDLGCDARDDLDKTSLDERCVHINVYSLF